VHRPARFLDSGRPGYIEHGRIEIYVTPHERAPRGAARRLRQWTCARKGRSFVVVGFSDHRAGSSCWSALPPAQRGRAWSLPEPIVEHFAESGDE
jgi:hypothetical protein